MLTSWVGGHSTVGDIRNATQKTRKPPLEGGFR
jgi:hypothetical protein